MRRLVAALFFFALGGGLVYCAFMYHVVHAEEGFLLIPKRQASLTDAWVDIRDWTVAQWQEHDLLARSLAGQGRSDLIAEPATNSILRGVLDAFRPPRSNPPGGRDSKGR